MLAAIFVFLKDLLDALKARQAEAARAQDRQAGADALASDIDAKTVETADAQLANDRGTRSVDDIADRLQHDADDEDHGGGAGAAQGPLRPADPVDGGAKA
ncbi:hypothetical protein GGD83_002884 [Rhodoblastus sphagnicola]|nr:hypothetical protein [Rhodoblastus sphagnicola]MBB4199073.1 hypothetical protein [Rhodoblastus sphagnicola]